MSLNDELAAIIAPIVSEAVEKAIERVSPAPATTYLSPEDAAAICGVKAETVRAWVKAGHLKAYWAGRLLRISRADLDAYLARPVAAGERVDIADKIVHLHATMNRRRR